ncbi:response regulator transcription factor [Methylotuvimicrobium buryatense]|uniref:Response regulator transcription factor n=1 Tax=Methylotuvimicrobium buryatense TaxID=95641 RepID=A0A4P9URG6_METBY|nr:response regulator transcription factor [Methylotuvimicrobium buryatense]QCW82256.1 response regulator transcription factor [Methylotuvimicrobium buryatense]
MTAANHSVNKGTVLIIDDTPGNLAFLSDTLSEAGYRVLVAIDGHSALEQIGFLHPDIILLDVVMPGIDGFETCRKIKSNPATTDIPILFMTGLGELDNLLRGFDEGGLDYIVKPIKPTEVLARVDVHLTQARTISRAKTALKHAPFAALTVDRSGRITWLTPCAETLLSQLTEKLDSSRKVEIGALPPQPISGWLREQIQANHIGRELPSEIDHILGNLSIKLSRSADSHEFLLLLQQRAGSRDWNLESLKDSLGLTLREAEILMWISRGKTNKEIGIILGSSPRTVNKHLEHIFEKLGVVTRAAAVAMVMQKAT